MRLKATTTTPHTIHKLRLINCGLLFYPCTVRCSGKIPDAQCGAQSNASFMEPKHTAPNPVYVYENVRLHVCPLCAAIDFIFSVTCLVAYAFRANCMANLLFGKCGISCGQFAWTGPLASVDAVCPKSRRLLVVGRLPNDAYENANKKRTANKAATHVWVFSRCIVRTIPTGIEIEGMPAMPTRMMRQRRMFDESTTEWAIERLTHRALTYT